MRRNYLDAIAIKLEIEESDSENGKDFDKIK